MLHFARLILSKSEGFPRANKMGTREEFEAELKKQGYRLYDGISTKRKKDGKSYTYNFGPYIMDIDVWPNKYKVKWDLECWVEAPTEFNSTSAIADTGFRQKGMTHDIKELIQTYRELRKHLKQNFIPKMTKSLEVPEELSDLLKEKK